jgi:hypothetical protein
MLSVRLDSETEECLEELVHQSGCASKSQLIKTLILEKWSASQPGKTFLERRGSLPDHLLNSSESLSERSTRKKKIAEILKPKSVQQKIK